MYTHRSTIPALLSVLLSLPLLSGCVCEDREDCPAVDNLRLELLYTLDPQSGGLPREVGDVRLYVFDQTTGLLADVLRVGARDIERGWTEALLPVGTYTFVAWADGGDDLTRGGYADAAMTDPASHIYTSPAQVGTTTLGQFRMTLVCDPLPGSSTEFVPRVGEFDDLYHAIARNVRSDGGGATVELDFVRNTSLLRVRVTGLEHLAPTTGRSSRAGAAPPSVFVTAPHERYGYDDRLDPLSRQVRFRPSYRSVSASLMAVDIGVHRLEVDTYAERPVTLHIQDPDTGADVVPPIDVVGTILSTKDFDGGYLWQTQRDVDRQGKFDMEIALAPGGGPTGLDVTVTVEGYRVVTPDADVDRP
jgi:hypothetical protein